jgi:hypothetical protein
MCQVWGPCPGKKIKISLNKVVESGSKACPTMFHARQLLNKVSKKTKFSVIPSCSVLHVVFLLNISYLFLI